MTIDFNFKALVTNRTADKMNNPSPHQTQIKTGKQKRGL